MFAAGKRILATTFAAGKRILATTPKPEVDRSMWCFLQVTQGLPQTPNIRLFSKERSAGPRFLGGLPRCLSWCPKQGPPLPSKHFPSKRIQNSLIALGIP